MRAATPTAAAELATPVLTDILEELQKLQLQTIMAFRNILKMRSQQVQHLQQSYIFQEPQRLYEGYVQNVDILTEKLISLEKQQITTAEGSFKTLNSRLLANTPASRIKMAKQNVEHLRQMTNNNITNRFSKYANDLNSLIGSLDTLSPLKIMSRGYTCVTRDMKVVKSIEDLSIDDKIQLNFSDGSANAVIKTINSEDK